MIAPSPNGMNIQQLMELFRSPEFMQQLTAISGMMGNPPQDRMSHMPIQPPNRDVFSPFKMRMGGGGNFNQPPPQLNRPMGQNETMINRNPQRQPMQPPMQANPVRSPGRSHTDPSQPRNMMMPIGPSNFKMRF